MEILDSLDQGKIARAWFAYIRQGVIREDLLRPLVARSWKRSPKLEYNSYISNKKIPVSKQRSLHSQNYDIIQAASTVMEYIFNLEEDSIVKLCDKNGYGLKSFQKYGEVVDSCYAEDKVGTNITGIILKEGTPNVIGGFEYLRVNWHHSYSGGIPIKDSKGNIMAVLSIHTLGKVPKLSLKLIENAGLIIEESLTNYSQYEVENSKYFNNLINKANHSLIIVEKNGRIVNANEQFWDTIGIRDKNSYLNEHLSKLIDKRSASLLLSESLNNTNVTFTTKTQNRISSFHIKSTNTIHHYNREDYILIVLQDKFSSANASVPQLIKLSLNTTEEDTNSFYNFIGQSGPIYNIKQTVKKVANLSSTVLILGESGTGKEVIAHAIHTASGRQGPFVPINCGAIPKELLESELFGYEEGTFTGAKKGGKPGKFEIANKGTLFLDEIGEMPINMQVALLRFLEDKMVIRMGASEPIKTDVRIIAATHRDLIKCISNNTFRQDLYYRLNVINLYLPPLREIKEDIPLLTRHILNQVCTQLNIPPLSIDNDSINSLQNYNWPGNVRELRNIIERVMILQDVGAVIASENLPSELLRKESQSGEMALEESIPVRFSYPLDYKSKVSETTNMIREGLIAKALESSNSNKTAAARLLGISRYTLIRELKKLGNSAGTQ